VRIEVHPDEKAERSRLCDVDFSLSRILGVSGFGVDTCPSGRAKTARVHREVGDATMSAATSAAVEPARPMTDAQLDQLSINCIRALSMNDAVQQAKSGHPGTPMGLAPLVYTLWNRVMRFDPQGPIWPNRDRFVLSNGHASMLLWSVLHLTGTRAVNAAYERLGQPAVSAVEQASTFGWERYVSKSGRVIGMKTFGGFCSA
jgi:transketolase-like protein